jgi:hypothetical protein
MDNLEGILVREGIEVDSNAPPISASFQFTAGPSSFFLPLSAHVMFASPSLLPRWQFSSQGLSLRSRTAHDPSWVSPYAALLSWSRPIPPSATHATSPRLQSSFASHVPAPPTAHSLSASSSGPPSAVFCYCCTRHQRRGPRVP